MKNLSEKIESLPSLQPEALKEIIKGMYQGKPLLGPQGLLTQIAKDLTQLALQGEMEAHLTENSLEEGSNRRNGLTTKTIKSQNIHRAIRNNTFHKGLFFKKVPRNSNVTEKIG